MAVNAVIIKGTPTIKWGTESVLGTPSGAIVDSIDISPKNADAIGEVENGDGATVNYAILKDGFNAKVSTVYDAAKTYPAEGDTVVLTLNKTGAAGGTATFSCSLTAMPQTYTRKKEAMISFNLIFRPGVVVS